MASLREFDKSQIAPNERGIPFSPQATITSAMMQKLRHLILIAAGMACLAFSSCVPIQKLYAGKTIPLTKENVSALDGYYEDYPLSDSTSLLWGIITENTYRTGRWDSAFVRKMETPGSYQVSITAVNRRKLIVRLLSEGEQIGKKRTIRGRLKDGSFCAQRTIILPFFPLVFGYMGRSLRIGLTENGIFVDSKSRDWGAAFGFGGSHRSVGSSAYGRVLVQ